MRKRFLRRAAKTMGVIVGLTAAGGAGGEQGRTDWIPNARTAIAVHWDQPVPEAQAEFTKRGYEGIRKFEHYPFSDERNCGTARKVTRSKAVVNLEGCYAYVDGGIFQNWQNLCRIFRFEFERYAGKEPRNPQHPRSCHNMR